MRTIDSFPHAVRVIENAWIEMPDGVRLAARIWLPEGAEDDPVPAILEDVPYRKRDLTVRRDSLMCPNIAGHGSEPVSKVFMLFHELGSEQMRGVGRPSMLGIVGRPTTKQVPLPSSPAVGLRLAAASSPSLPDAPASGRARLLAGAYP